MQKKLQADVNPPLRYCTAIPSGVPHAKDVGGGSAEILTNACRPASKVDGFRFSMGSYASTDNLTASHKLSGERPCISAKTALLSNESAHPQSLLRMHLLYPGGYRRGVSDSNRHSASTSLGGCHRPRHYPDTICCTLFLRRSQPSTGMQTP